MTGTPIPLCREKITSTHLHGHIYTTQVDVIDEINFEIPYGRIGKLFEGYAYARLQKLFNHRKTATIRTLEGNR